MSVPVYRPQVSSDFDDTWHTYSLIFNSDFVVSFFDREANKGERGKMSRKIIRGKRNSWRNGCSRLDLKIASNFPIFLQTILV